jgi:hypothetical protein
MFLLFPSFVNFRLPAGERICVIAAHPSYTRRSPCVSPGITALKHVANVTKFSDIRTITHQNGCFLTIVPTQAAAPTPATVRPTRTGRLQTLSQPASFPYFCATPLLA